MEILLIIFIIVEFFLLLFLTENEQTFLSTASILIFFAIIAALGYFNVFTWAYHNAGLCLGCFAGYFVVGSIWVFPKWWLYCQGILDKFRDDKENRNISYYGNSTGNYISKLDLNKNKNRILNWMMFWPLSMISTFLDDFVTRIFRAIYNRIRSQLQAISDKTINQINRESKNDDG